MAFFSSLKFVIGFIIVTFIAFQLLPVIIPQIETLSNSTTEEAWSEITGEGGVVSVLIVFLPMLTVGGIVLYMLKGFGGGSSYDYPTSYPSYEEEEYEPEPIEEDDPGAYWICEHCGASVLWKDNDCFNCGSPRKGRRYL